jgi:hypothetical protein
LIKYWIVAAAAFTELSGAAFAASKHCDRACMTAITDQYLAALVKHDPSGLPLSRGVRFTENTAEIRVGNGLWVGASEAPTSSRFMPSIPHPTRWAFTES